MLLLPFVASLALEVTPSASPEDLDAPQLFTTHCANCHGADGDGRGTTELDRPARSFKDGGFSYGNTEEALMRTITHGIPGTPMPSFATSLTLEERRALASYVVTLGPPVERASVEETVLSVTDRPIVVRGYLPPIGGRGLERPRGLLVGHPSGLSFEYRADDVRLLGVRSGGFVERKDWIGRGGAALAPIGKVVRLFDDGDPPPNFEFEGRPLAAKLRRTDVLEADVKVAYELLGDSGRIGRVEEIVRPTAIPGTAGFERKLAIAVEDAGVRMRVASLQGRRLLASFGSSSGKRWWITRGPDGVEALGLATFQAEGVTQNNLVLRVELMPAPAQVDVTYLSIPVWNDEVKAALIQELSR